MSKKSVSEIIDAPIDDVWWVLQDTMDSTVKGEYKVKDRVSQGDERLMKMFYDEKTARVESTAELKALGEERTEVVISAEYTLRGLASRLPFVNRIINRALDKFLSESIAYVKAKSTESDETEQVRRDA